MMEEKKYKNKYRVKSARRDGCDYSRAGEYFVTICARNKEMFFGGVVGEGEEAEMKLSEIEKIAVKCWLEIPAGFNNIILDEFVIMPNHVHGIIVIDCADDAVETRRGASLREYKNKFGPLAKNSLSSIINHYKGNIKRFCNKNSFEYFAWQTRFYDRIIRSEKELNNARTYILNNPLKWHLDKNNPENLFM